MVGANFAYGQFPPAAGEAGSTAILATDTDFVNWAMECEVERGLRDITQPDSGYVDLGIATDALGQADQLVVSLGDGGQATLSFTYPIQDEEGWDFAVFENGFRSGHAYFLELAFVEVSSDGTHFVRFPTSSLTPADTQLGPFDLLDPTQLHNLAGKYVGGYGVPFDLNELRDSSGIDLERITHVRIIDVIGSIDPAFASYDQDGRIINDPWPTPFQSGGFDLDAVGVFYENRITSTNKLDQIFDFSIYPNPITEEFMQVRWNASRISEVAATIYTSLGVKILYIPNLKPNQRVNLQDLPVGSYYLQIQTEDLNLTRLIIKTNG